MSKKKTKYGWIWNSFEKCKCCTSPECTEKSKPLRVKVLSIEEQKTAVLKDWRHRTFVSPLPLGSVPSFYCTTECVHNRPNNKVPNSQFKIGDEVFYTVKESVRKESELAGVVHKTIRGWYKDSEGKLRINLESAHRLECATWDKGLFFKTAKEARDAWDDKEAEEWASTKNF